MGFFSKLFGKSKKEENQEVEEQQPIYENLPNTKIEKPGLEGMEPRFKEPIQYPQHPQQSMSPESDDKEFQIISSKIDVLNSKIDALSQKLENIEEELQEEAKPRW
tara:strand:+ start:146 stop:463 length:318 start_codon:yes stop_codon:yes gene_type:complete